MITINFSPEPENSANSSNARAPPYIPVLFLNSNVPFSRILILSAVMEIDVPSFFTNATLNFEVILIVKVEENRAPTAGCLTLLPVISGVM